MAQTFQYGDHKYEVANPDGVESLFWEMGSNYPDYPTLWVILLGGMSPTRIALWGEPGDGGLEGALETAAAYAAEKGYLGLVAPFGSVLEREMAADAEGDLLREGLIHEHMDEEEAQGLVWDRLDEGNTYTESGWMDQEWRYEEHGDINDPFYVSAALNSAAVVTAEGPERAFPAPADGSLPLGLDIEAYCDKVLDGEEGEWWQAPFCIWGTAATKEGRSHWHALLVDIGLPWDDDDLNEHPVFDVSETDGNVWWLLEEAKGKYLKYRLVLIARYDYLDNLLVMQDYALGRWDWSAEVLWPPAPGLTIVRGADKLGILATTAAAKQVEQRRAPQPKQNAWPKVKVNKSQLRRIMRGAMK